ncbi:hypothetical protein EYF80_024286 [Liparis tanakae]|uniref:Uncharacterized protein n=1 Tax=Liparis tanakae TaxID=230148 RepID=A0A4Z2HI04_9TELE|nr:hypothetical protein EYF80_024286 [Liparis tanakae]
MGQLGTAELMDVAAVGEKEPTTAQQPYIRYNKMITHGLCSMHGTMRSTGLNHTHHSTDKLLYPNEGHALKRGE